VLHDAGARPWQIDLTLEILLDALNVVPDLSVDES
jgi:hypothetical protein